MPTKTQLSLLVALSAGLWLIILAVSGLAVSLSLLRPYTLVVSALGATLLVFDKWLWKSHILAGWLVRRPDISGTWLASLSPVDESEASSDTKNVYVAVYQTYSSLSVRLYSEESSSELLSGEISRAADNTYRFVVVYRNTPRISLQGRSRPHLGAMFLSVSSTLQVSLSGHYWTDRRSLGEINFTERSRKIADSLSAAQALFAA